MEAARKNWESAPPSKLGELIDLRFTKRAAEARGVRIPRSPRETKEAVERAISAEHALDRAQILVEVRDGVLLLRGRVPEARLRSLALECVDDIPEVHVIRNEIRVRPEIRKV